MTHSDSTVRIGLKQFKCHQSHLVNETDATSLVAIVFWHKEQLSCFLFPYDCSLVVQSFRWCFVFFSLLFMKQTHTVFISFHLYENNRTQPKVWVWGSDKQMLQPCLVKPDAPRCQNSLSVNSVVCVLLFQSWRESACSCSSARLVNINFLFDGEEGLH